jgi:hypothetical protein
MDMSFIFLVTIGFLTCVLAARLFQTVIAVVARRGGEKRLKGKRLSACPAYPSAYR